MMQKSMFTDLCCLDGYRTEVDLNLDLNIAKLWGSLGLDPELELKLIVSLCLSWLRPKP